MRRWVNYGTADLAEALSAMPGPVLMPTDLLRVVKRRRAVDPPAAIHSPHPTRRHRSASTPKPTNESLGPTRAGAPASGGAP